MDRYLKHERLKIDNGKHISVEDHTASIEHPLHWHSYFEIEIILSGAGKYVINDVEHDIEKNNVFFLTPTDFHSLELSEETKLINISFDEECVDERDIASLLFSGTRKAYSFDHEEHERIVMAARLLSHECDSGGECTIQLLKYLLQCIIRKNTVTYDAAPVKNEHYRGIKKAIVFLELHFKDDVTLADAAKEAGYHPTYFSELFKKVTGESFTESLTRLRISYAKMLLANGISATDACFMSGFRSFSNFTATFKKLCKISPGQYKIKHSSK